MATVEFGKQLLSDDQGSHQVGETNAGFPSEEAIRFTAFLSWNCWVSISHPVKIVTMNSEFCWQTPTNIRGVCLHAFPQKKTLVLTMCFWAGIMESRFGVVQNMYKTLICVPGSRNIRELTIWNLHIYKNILQRLNQPFCFCFQGS